MDHIIYTHSGLFHAVGTTWVGSVHDAYKTAQAVVSHPENRSTHVLPENNIQFVKDQAGGLGTTLDQAWGQTAPPDKKQPRPTT